MVHDLPPDGPSLPSYYGRSAEKQRGESHAGEQDQLSGGMRDREPGNNEAAGPDQHE